MLVTGLILAPAIILQQNLVVKSVQTCLFLALAVLSVSVGKRRLIIGSTIFITTTIIVNLFSPVGRVILRIGPLRITQGALYLGISKATTLASLLYLSRICVRPSVRLPGVLGQYIAETFAYLGKLLARRERVSRHNIVRSLDEQFENIFESDVRKLTGFPTAANTPSGILLLALLLILNWAAVFFPFSLLLAKP